MWVWIYYFHNKLLFNIFIYHFPSSCFTHSFSSTSFTHHSHAIYHTCTYSYIHIYAHVDTSYVQYMHIFTRRSTLLYPQTPLFLFFSNTFHILLENFLMLANTPTSAWSPRADTATHSASNTFAVLLEPQLRLSHTLLGVVVGAVGICYHARRTVLAAAHHFQRVPRQRHWVFAACAHAERGEARDAGQVGWFRKGNRNGID